MQHKHNGFIVVVSEVPLLCFPPLASQLPLLCPAHSACLPSFPQALPVPMGIHRCPFHLLRTPPLPSVPTDTDMNTYVCQWRGGSAVRDTCCSGRGHRPAPSAHVRLCTITYNSSSRGSDAISWPPHAPALVRHGYPPQYIHM